MNLIEQFGYEKLKEMRGTTQHALLCIGGCEPIHVNDVDSMLLQHRRENNIYETGDFVFEVTPHGETDILVVKHIDSKIMVCENDNLNASYVLSNNSPSFYVRHATDKEITQGYRDDCSHEYNIDLLGGADKCVRCGNIKK